MASRCGCPGRSAHVRSSDVFPLPAGAEMIVTFFAAARSRAARRSPRPISLGFARSTVKGLPLPAPDAQPSATQSSRYQASARSVNAHQSPGSGDDHSPARRPAWIPREGSHGCAGTCPSFKGVAMSDHVAIVAGAGGALGHATTAGLAASGLTVVAVDRNEHALRELPDGVRPEVADTTDPAAVKSLIDRIADEVGLPEVLVNTIGTFRPGDALTTTPETLRLMVDVNLGPALWLSQAVAPHMQQRGFRCHRAC